MKKRIDRARLPFLALLAVFLVACLPSEGRGQSAEPVFDVTGIRAVDDGQALYVTATGRVPSLGWRAIRLAPLPDGGTRTGGRLLTFALVGVPPEGMAATAMDEVRATWRHVPGAGSARPEAVAIHAAGNVLELSLTAEGELVDGLRSWCIGSLCDTPLTTTGRALQERIRRHMEEYDPGGAAQAPRGCSPSCGAGEECVKWCGGGGHTGEPWDCAWRCVQAGPGGAYPNDPDPGPPTPVDPPPPPQPQPPPPQADPACMSYCSITCSGLGGGAFAACMSGCAMHCAAP